MKHLNLSNLRLLIVLSCCLFIAEILRVYYSHCNQYGINSLLLNIWPLTSAKMQSTAISIANCQWSQIWLVQLFTWLFTQKIYYILLLLAIVIIYFKTKELMNYSPQVSNNYSLKGKYGSQTDNQLRKLGQSQEFNKFIDQPKKYQHPNKIKAPINCDKFIDQSNDEVVQQFIQKQNQICD